jgi:hypothetical protein
MLSSEKPKCKYCGKEATRFAKDPWKEEWNPGPENEEEWWCERCFLDALKAI